MNSNLLFLIIVLTLIDFKPKKFQSDDNFE